jgi:hypothetical protein
MNALGRADGIIMNSSELPQLSTSATALSSCAKAASSGILSGRSFRRKPIAVRGQSNNGERKWKRNKLTFFTTTGTLKRGTLVLSLRGSARIPADSDCGLSSARRVS